MLANAANGEAGQALLDLMRAHGVSAIGAAVRPRHDIVRSYGATRIEGKLVLVACENDPEAYPFVTASSLRPRLNACVIKRIRGNNEQ